MTMINTTECMTLRALIHELFVFVIQNTKFQTINWRLGLDLLLSSFHIHPHLLANELTTEKVEGCQSILNIGFSDNVFLRLCGYLLYHWLNFHPQVQILF